MGSRREGRFVAGGGCTKEPCDSGDFVDEQKERDQLDDPPHVTLAAPHSKPWSPDGEGYSADNFSMDEDRKNSPHVAEVQSSKPKPRFKGRYNFISRLFLL